MAEPVVNFARPLAKDGKRGADVAATLGLSVRTVENHLRKIRQRLRVRTTAQAVSAAARLGETR